MADEDAPKPDEASESAPDGAQDADVEAEAEAEAPAAEEVGKRKWRRIRQKPSKRWRAARKQTEGRDAFQLGDAIRLVKNFKNANFEEAFELHVRLGVDPKRPDQQVRGTFVFPHGIGQEKRVIAFAEGDLAEKAKAAGAIEVGGAELAKKISDGWMDFDVVIAHPAMMRHIGRLGRVLGPRGLMPNPKSGTVTPNVDQAVEEFKAGKVGFRLDEGANLHLVVGRKSFEADKLEDNIRAFLRHLESLRPSGAKGIFMEKATVCSTMSPGVRVELAS